MPSCAFCNYAIIPYNGHMELDVAIPAHNEEGVILPTLVMISDELNKISGLRWRIIVAENGSTDQTYNVVKNAKLPQVEVFRAKRVGKGAALKEALERSTAQYFGFIDADCSPHPKTFKVALDILETTNADMVVGSRFDPRTTEDRGLFRNVSSRMFNLCAHAIVGVHVEDTQCPMKVMRKSGADELRGVSEDRWLVDLELIARAERSGLSIVIVPVEWKELRYEGRKSKLNLPKDGGGAILGMIEIKKRLSREKQYGTQSI